VSFSVSQAETIVEILREAARLDIMPCFNGQVALDVRHKTSHTDLVTAADEAAERRITARLLQAFPHAMVIGEEACSADSQLLGRLAEADLAIIVDPIDGTKNFASSLPLFGVMAAVVDRGETVGGIILDPVVDDYALALKGEGAWTVKADGSRQRMRVAAPRPLSEMVGHVSWTYLDEPARTNVLRNLPLTAGSADYRCAAHQYRSLAAGHYDFALFGKLMPWDHAAGTLLHAEAGGYSAILDGSPYAAHVHSGGIICAPDEASWHVIRDSLIG
jgi:fructose-1,6-bisphosphatase/inositol monophosphatase family enzyme